MGVLVLVLGREYPEAVRGSNVPTKRPGQEPPAKRQEDEHLGGHEVAAALEAPAGHGPDLVDVVPVARDVVQPSVGRRAAG